VQIFVGERRPRMSRLINRRQGFLVLGLLFALLATPRLCWALP
jgi:hypothetical protein